MSERRIFKQRGANRGIAGTKPSAGTLAERSLDFAETELGRTTTLPDERGASRRVGSASFRRDGLDAARQRAAHRLDEVRACRRRSVLPRANGLIRTTLRLSTATGSSGRKFARVAASFAGRRPVGGRRTRHRKRSTFGWTPRCWPISAPPAPPGNRGSTRRSARRQRSKPMAVGEMRRD